MNWLNGGETPAKNTMLKTNSNAFYPDIPAEYDFPLTDKFNVVIGPKSVYGSNIQIPRDVIVDYWRYQRRIFTWGDVLYNDEFAGSPPRLTEFCIEFTHLVANTLKQTINPGQITQAPSYHESERN